MNNEPSVTEEVSQEIGEETSALVRLVEDIDWQGVAVNFAVAAIKVVVVGLIIFLAYKFFYYLLNRFFNHRKSADNQLDSKYITLKSLLNNILLAIAWFLFIYTALGLFGVPVGTLLAGAGVIGLAVSLGAQGFVNDFINGFRIIFEEQMHVGDSVILDDVEGIVQSVGLQTTVVKAFDGTHHYIPNREIIVVGNKSRANLRVLIEIPLYTDTDLDQVRRVIDRVNQELMVTFKQEITDQPSSVDFIPYTKGQIAAQIIMFTHPDDVFTVRNKAFEIYIDRLAEAGIDLPDFHLPVAE